MSHPVLNRRAAGRSPRLRSRAAGAIVLGSMLFAAVSVSTASASEPPPASDGLVVDAAGNTVLPAPSTGSGTEYIVQLKHSADVDDVVADVAADGVKVTGTMEGAIDAFTAPLDAAALTELRARDDVVRVVRQHVYELNGVQDDPPWGLDRVDQRPLPLNSRYSYQSTGAGVDVYVIDSGIPGWLQNGTEFGGRIKRSVKIGPDLRECDWHGTHVAGIVGGTTWGVAKAVSIVPVDVFQCNQQTTPTAAIVTGINWVIDVHQAGQPAVVNMSMSGPVDAVLDDAVKAMVADGITVVAAAGNDANTSSCDQSPAHVPEVITVAASDSHDVRASFSSPGSCNDLFAPGVDIESADYQSDTGSVLQSGTSMAAAHVAGAAALILQQNPVFTPAQVWAAMEADTTKGVITGEGTGDPDKLLHVAPEPKPLPSAPTGLTAAVAPAAGVGAGQVELTWTAPADAGDFPIADYVVEKSPRNLSSWSTVDDGVSTATATTVSGLSNGTLYWFRVSAKSAGGVGPTTGSISATPASVPDAIGLTASVWPTPGVGAGEVRLLWSGLSNGSAITDYLIQISHDGATWRTASDGVSAVSSLTWLGLSGGTAYSFRVAAKNALGTGPWTAAVTATPASPPAIPTGLTAAVPPAADVGAGQVKLTWTVPRYSGAAVTDYLIESSVDGTTWTTVNDPVSSATTHTLTNLTGGTNYSFRVAAKNALGTGPWSVPVTATPATEPGSPAGLSAAVAPAAGVGSGEVQLSWTAPSANGSAITDYLIQSSLDGTTWTTVDDAVATSPSAMVRGLINGTEHRFRVAASNGAGTGPWSATVSATPLGSPEAPGGLTAAVAPAAGVSSGQVKLSWTAPGNENGSAVADYRIESSTDGVTWTTVDDAVATSPSAMVRGLTNGTEYSFRVAALNAVGVGGWSAVVTASPVGRPGAPDRLATAVAPATGVGSGQVKLTWNPAASTGGATITDYVIERSTGGSSWTAVRDGVSPARSSLVRGLTNGTRYRFRVAAVNGIGQGPWSSIVGATPRWKPGAPGGLRATVAPTAGVGSRQVKLTWNAPGSSGGAAITDYLIQRSSNGIAWTTVRDGVSTTRSYLVARLTNDTQYRFRVAARNIVGQGSWSTVVRATPHAR